MSIISTLRRILNDTPGTATNIDYNFQVLEDYVNTAVVLADGSVAMSGPLTLPGPGVSPNHAATVSQLAGSIPTGVIWDFGGDTAPLGWHICDFSVQSSTDPQFKPLWDVIGYKFGDAGGGNFRLPPPGRVYVGRDPAVPIFDTVGKTGGQRDAELLQHFHVVPAHGHTATASQINVDHQHSIDPPNTASNEADVQRQFGGGNAQYHSPPGSGAYGPYNTAGISVNIPAFNSGAMIGNNLHTPTISVVNQVAFNSENQGAGTTLVDKNLSPFAVVTKIIKL